MNIVIFLLVIVFGVLAAFRFWVKAFSEYNPVYLCYCIVTSVGLGFFLIASLVIPISYDSEEVETRVVEFPDGRWAVQVDNYLSHVVDTSPSQNSDSVMMEKGYNLLGICIIERPRFRNQEIPFYAYPNERKPRGL